jgi:hypothetical protein
MATPAQQMPNDVRQGLSDAERTTQTILQLKNSTDPQKWTFIEEIKSLAEQQNNYSYSTLEAIVSNSQKTIQDLFYIKYDLSLNGLIVTDLLINFRDIRKKDYLITFSEKQGTGSRFATTHHYDLLEQAQPKTNLRTSGL